MKMDILQISALLLCVLMSALAGAENEIVKLRITNLARLHCHASVSMSCDVISQKEPEIMTFAWMGPDNKTKLCQVDKHERVTTNSSGVHCTYRRKQLNLTIRHMKPIDEGQYLCKLRSNFGTKHSNTHLKLQDCHDPLHYHYNDDGNVTCQARGVYPEAHIHWFQGPKNLTQSSMAHPSIKAEDGTFKIASTLLQRPASALNCSLWSQSTGRYLSTTQVLPEATPPQPQGRSRANCLGATWTIVTLFAAVLIP